MSRSASPRTRAPSPAPGVTRLGDETVNFYLLETPDGLVLIDGGLPGHLPQLTAYLASAGRSLRDIRAILLTHAHPDHTGVVAAAQRAGAEIWVHERDAAALAGGPRATMRHARPERPLPGYLIRHPASLRTIVHIARQGGLTAPPITQARHFHGDRRLTEVPGQPHAISLPGHTPGSVGYLLPDRGLLFTGDALVTYDGITGHRGPTVVSRAFTHNGQEALNALATIETVNAALLLPGHGQPFAGSPGDAVAQARRAGLR